MSRKRFEVGDLVILQHPTFFHEYDGAPGVVIGGLVPREAVDLNTMRRCPPKPAYRVRMLTGDGLEVHALPYQLRRPHEPAPAAAGLTGSTREV